MWCYRNAESTACAPWYHDLPVYGYSLSEYFALFGITAPCSWPWSRFNKAEGPSKVLIGPLIVARPWWVPCLFPHLRLPGAITSCSITVNINIEFSEMQTLFEFSRPMTAPLPRANDNSRQRSFTP